MFQVARKIKLQKTEMKIWNPFQWKILSVDVRFSFFKGEKSIDVLSANNDDKRFHILPSLSYPFTSEWLINAHDLNIARPIFY